MDKKKLWITFGIIGVMIPVIVLLCFFAMQPDTDKYELEPIPAANGGTIAAADRAAASVKLNADGTSVSDAVYEFKSQYGYSLQYNNKYTVDLSGKQYDFYITNKDSSVSVAVSVMDMDDTVGSIQTKEEWDAAMMPVMGVESVAFNRTQINGMDVLASNYYINDQSGTVAADVLMAMFMDEDKIYSYFYIAATDADETEKQQIGAILYTIQ